VHVGTARPLLGGRAVGGHGHHDSRRHPAQAAGSPADAPEAGPGWIAPFPENRTGEAGAAGPGPISARPLARTTTTTVPNSSADSQR
jgi:hypothetical protein